jgi:hypothetical protein
MRHLSECHPPQHSQLADNSWSKLRSNQALAYPASEQIIRVSGIKILDEGIRCTKVWKYSLSKRDLIPGTIILADKFLG